ncbi:hypothetical protein LINPERHAP1_LOCUS16083 [Linum perenne]
MKIRQASSVDEVYLLWRDRRAKTWSCTWYEILTTMKTKVLVIQMKMVQIVRQMLSSLFFYIINTFFCNKTNFQIFQDIYIDYYYYY